MSRWVLLSEAQWLNSYTSAVQSSRTSTGRFSGGQVTGHSHFSTQQGPRENIYQLNIHNILLTGSWNSEGGGGVLELEFWRHWSGERVIEFGIPNTWGFQVQRGKMVKASLELLIWQLFQFVNEAWTDHRNRIKIDQAGDSGWVVQKAPHQIGLKVNELVNSLIKYLSSLCFFLI